MNLDKLQKEMQDWREINFPGGNDDNQLFGVMEELGELAHAHLKAKQGIRINEDHEVARIDAIGDLCIFLLGYCSYRGLSLRACIESAWDEVKKRDWNKNKETGK